MNLHGTGRRPRRRLAPWPAALLLAAALGPAPGRAQAPAGQQRVWGTEAYNLERGETFQFQVTFAEVPLRRWTLVVDGDQRLCDVSVVRQGTGALLYARRRESHHEVSVPFGRDEAVNVAITADFDNGGGTYTVTFLGPDADRAPEVYGYTVNRALEAYAAGETEKARRLVAHAVQADPGDGVAQVLWAGFLQEAGDHAGALAALRRALAGPLPPDIAATAHVREGEALLALDRRYQAAGAWTAALGQLTDPAARAVLALRLGRLYVELRNPAQARAALQWALRDGLAPEDRAEAERLLRTLSRQE